MRKLQQNIMQLFNMKRILFPFNIFILVCLLAKHPIFSCNIFLISQFQIVYNGQTFFRMMGSKMQKIITHQFIFILISSNSQNEFMQNEE